MKENMSEEESDWVCGRGRARETVVNPLRDRSLLPGPKERKKRTLIDN